MSSKSIDILKLTMQGEKSCVSETVLEMVVARCESPLLIDTSYDLQRLKQKWKHFGERLRVLEDDDIDEDYRVALFDLLACKKKRDKDDIIIKHKKRLEAYKKRKEIRESSDHCEEESDPQYELFLEHLKAHDKSYMLEYQKNGVLIKYEGDTESDMEGDLEPEPRRKLDRAHPVVNEKILMKLDRGMLTRVSKCKYGPSDRMCGVENQHKRRPRVVSVKKTSKTDKVECFDGPRAVIVHKRQTVVNEKIPMEQDVRMLTSGLKRKYGLSDQMCGVENRHKHNPRSNLVKKTCPRNVNIHKGEAEKIYKRKKENGGKLPRAVKGKCGISNQGHRVENVQCTLVKKTKSPTGGKSRNETNRKVNHVGCTMAFENDRKKQTVRGLDGNGKNRAELPKKIMNGPMNVRTKIGSAKENWKVKSAKSIMAYEKDRSDSEVVILDEAVCIKEGVFSPFVSSKRFDSTEEDGILRIGGSSASDVFRKEVLDVLKKPYDRKEYTRLVAAVREGQYREFYPDLGGKFKQQKYRYNRRRRLAILRGFFFWLQNLTREGSFKPWKDRACLEVEPPSP